MRDWVTNIRTTHYIIGSAVGPHPFPDIVRDLQAVIGTEARAQMLNDTKSEKKIPRMKLVALLFAGASALAPSRRAFLSKVAGAATGAAVAAPARADTDYAGLPYLGGSEKIDVNNANVRVYAKLPGMYPGAAGKIA